MTVTITITKQLDDTWASPKELAEMSDEQILELVQEDLFALHDGATYQVDREYVFGEPSTPVRQRAQRAQGE